MDESILKSIKDLLGISESDEAFDQDVLININAIFSTLYQLGVGSKRYNYVVTEADTWYQVFYDFEDLIGFIKLYTYMKVKIVFDPPTNSSILDALNNQIKEIEWRITMQADPSKFFEEDGPCDCESGIVTDEDVRDMWGEIMS